MDAKAEPVEWSPITCPQCNATIPRGRIPVGRRFPCPACKEPLRTSITWALSLNAVVVIAGLIPGIYFHLDWQYLFIGLVVLYFPLFILVGIIAMVKCPPELQRALPDDPTLTEK